jgi:hypothetical protein
MLLLMLALVAPLSFAAGGWEGTAALAIAVSAGFLGVIYAVAVGFSINELQIMAKEELYQLIATGILVVLLVGGNNIIDGISAGFSTNGVDNLQTLAATSIETTLKSGPDGLETIYGRITALDRDISIEGSKTVSCSILAIGYTVSACGGYTMLSTPLSMAGGILGFAIGEMYSMKRLIVISTTYSLSLLLPIGIVLRTFKLTRGAGGFLIATAVCMHILLPVGILFNQMLVDTFLAAPQAAGYGGGVHTSIEECDPDDVAFAGVGKSQNEKAGEVLDSFADDLRRVVFSVLVRGTLGPVLALLMMTAGIRALTSLAGAEVDVSALGRFI